MTANARRRDRHKGLAGHPLERLHTLFLLPLRPLRPLSSWATLKSWSSHVALKAKNSRGPSRGFPMTFVGPVKCTWPS